MIDDLVPCKHATDYEIARGVHLTREESGMCNPCQALIELFEVKRVDAAADAAVEERLARNRAAQETARANHPSARKTVDED